MKFKLILLMSNKSLRRHLELSVESSRSLTPIFPIVLPVNLMLLAEDRHNARSYLSVALTTASVFYDISIL